MASGLDGVASLTRQLRALGKLDDGKAVQASVAEAIKPAREMARALAPVGTVAHYTYRGRLVGGGFARRSIQTRVTVSRDKQAAFADLGVEKEAFYAVTFVELGTSKQPAQPWLVPAFELTQSRQEAGIARGLERSIDKASRLR